MTNAFLQSLVDARLDDALSSAAGGRPLIVRARRADTAEQIAGRAVSGRAMLDVIDVPLDDARSPLEALLEAAAAQEPSIVELHDLCRSSALSSTLFMIDARGLDPGPWLTLAGTFAARRAREDEGPALTLIMNGSAVPAGCDLLDDGDFFGPAEAAVFVREHRPTPSLLAACGDAAAIEVARGDFDQLGAMLQLSDQSRFDPTTWIARQPVSETKLVWRGVEEVCSTWLAANNPARLQRRIWRGQVTILFPWLAEALGSFLDIHAKRLPRNLRDPWSGDLIRPEEFEWSNILFVLNRIQAREADCAFRLRRMRNALAHQEALTWDEARNAEADLKTLLAWR